MKISAVCFDLGKVLLHFDWKLMLDRIAEKSPLLAEEITRLLQRKPHPSPTKPAPSPPPNFSRTSKSACRYKGTAKELRAIYNEIFTPLTEHIALAALLAPHYPLAIISNTNESHILYAEETYSFFSLFHARIYSHQVKAMKPEIDLPGRAHRARRNRSARGALHRRHRNQHPRRGKTRVANDPSPPQRRPPRSPRQLRAEGAGLRAPICCKSSWCGYCS